MSHSIQKLLFFVAHDSDGKVARRIKDFVQALASSRRWSVQSPVFVNECSEGVLTLGGYLSVFNALPPHKLAPELDRLNFEEVRDFVGKLELLSRECGLAFELELDGVHVGVVQGGQMDRSIRIGLLEEWERVLRSREASKATS